MQTEGGRVGVSIRMEECLPRLLRREIFPCPRCSARFIKWLIKRYLLSRNGEITIRLDDVWIHSDSDNSDDEITIDAHSDFWAVMRLTEQVLEEARSENEKKSALEGLKSYRILASEYEDFCKFKQEQKEKELAKVHETNCPPKNDDSNDSNSSEKSPLKPSSTLTGDSASPAQKTRKAPRLPEA